jgi:site-specific DNA-methyltransferase (adenine-specific)
MYVRAKVRTYNGKRTRYYYLVQTERTPAPRQRVLAYLGRKPFITKAIAQRFGILPQLVPRHTSLARPRLNSVIQGDAPALMATLPSQSFDAIIADPPYPSLEAHRARGTTTRLTRAWFPPFNPQQFPTFLAQCYRLLTRHAHCYIFANHQLMRALVPQAERVGFTFYKPLIWYKGTLGMGYHYRNTYELILFFAKGHRLTRNRRTPDVLTVPPVRNGYPTQKPVSLIHTLISQSTDPGDYVLDPFTGAGTVPLVCQLTGRQYLAIDPYPEAIRATTQRLSHLDTPTP